jgi:hypothetical protein
MLWTAATNMRRDMTSMMRLGSPLPRRHRWPSVRCTLALTFLLAGGCSDDVEQRPGTNPGEHVSRQIIEIRPPATGQTFPVAFYDVAHDHGRLTIAPGTSWSSAEDVVINAPAVVLRTPIDVRSQFELIVPTRVEGVEVTAERMTRASLTPPVTLPLEDNRFTLPDRPDDYLITIETAWAEGEVLFGAQMRLQRGAED